MKKILAFTVAFIIAINFSGCSISKKTVNLAENGYTCIGEIFLEDSYKVTAEISVLGGGLLNIKIISPKLLRDMIFSFDNNNISVEFKGLKKEISSEKDINIFASYIGGAFLKATAGNEVATLSNDGFYYKNNYRNSSFSLKVDKNGFPICLEFAQPKIKVNFSDFSY